MPKTSKRGGASRPKTHAPRKRFGQNFLTDQGVISAIARAINPHKDDNVVEIGPGQGALTDALFESGCAIKAIEIDRDLQSQLRVMFFNRDFTLFNFDALKFDFNELSDGNHDLRIVGNLPYNISTPLIFKPPRICPSFVTCTSCYRKKLLSIRRTPVINIGGD